ncbi:uncharacterized protein LOC119583044 [Penaeus monodon]|uniref:uncharacterized protein LOC119583044 n=1 Tax=Penaeus monodon TaxID=6687 RepID=UPI0018A71867|nr:uncharacterized protein LOC119583044 [Penaeus monodon]
MNGHVGSGNDAISRIHGGNAYGNGDEDGEKVTDLALSFDMVIGNTLFRKRNEHLITYKSGDRASQIDLILYRRRNIGEIKNCKVIPGDLSHDMVDVNTWWNDASNIILRAGKEILGKKEIWWLNEEVQEQGSAKKKAKKKWEESKLDEDRAAYKRCCKEAKKAVAIAKSEAYDYMYE